MAEEIKVSGQQLQKMFDAMKDSLEQSTKDQLGGLLIEFETMKHKQEVGAGKKELEEIESKINGKIKEMGDSLGQFIEDAKKNQTLIDELAADRKRKSANKDEKFEDSWSKMIREELNVKTKGKSAEDDLGIGIGRGRTELKFEMKTILTTSNAITGGGMNAYNPRQGLLPTANIHMRDLLPTVQSKNGLFVTYSETNSAQSAGVQTEGSAKTALNYAFTATTKTLKYIAGFSTFSKQLLFNLDFLEGSLPRMLMRDFFRKEDDYLYTTIAGNATGNNAAANPTPSVDVEEIIRMIANQRNANFNADIAVVDWTEWARILTTKPNDYSLPAGTVVNNQGTTTIAGTPIIGASWAQTDHLLLWDRDYVERVEAEGVKVEFSYENQDNFEKNLVTARVECFEEVNMLRSDAVIYRDFANS